MEISLVSESFDEELPTRRASWNVPHTVASTPSWIAPPIEKKTGEPQTPPPPKLPTIEEIINEEVHVAPVLYEKQDTEELARLAGEIATLREQLAQAAGVMGRMRVELLRESEPELVRLALAIAERVVGREITTSPAVVLDWAREGLAVLGGKRVASVVVSTDVAQAFSDADRNLLGVQVTVDTALPAGSCVVRSDDARVDVSASSRLRTVAEALESPAEAP